MFTFFQFPILERHYRPKSFRQHRSLCFSGEGWVEISWQDIRAGVAKSYVTTEQNGHTHTLLLTAGELAGLRAGKTLTKQTSRNARPGGRQHTHTVTLSCRA